MRSVVLASYQGAPYLKEQLDSILLQLSAEDEIVVSDDASTDGTVDIAKEFGDPRIRVLAHQSRVGYIANFQRAIESSRGDRIFFSDQDDIWLPEKVVTLERLLPQADCVASDARVVDEQLQLLHQSYFEWRGASSFSPWSIYLKPPIVGATLACNRSYLQALLPFPAGIPHDFWLTLNAAYDRRLGIVKEPLILYRRHPNAFSVSGTRNRRSFSEIAVERARLFAAMLRHRILR